MGDRGLLPLRFHRPNTVALQELSEMIRDAAAAPLEKQAFIASWSSLPGFIVGSPSDHRHLREHSTVAQGAGYLRRVVGCALADRPRHIANAAAEPAELRAGRCGRHRGCRLTFDHRVFDGALAGRALARLEEVLNSSILEELRDLAKSEFCRRRTEGVCTRPAQSLRPRQITEQKPSLRALKLRHYPLWCEAVGCTLPHSITSAADFEAESLGPDRKLTSNSLPPDRRNSGIDCGSRPLFARDLLPGESHRTLWCGLSR